MWLAKKVHYWKHKETGESVPMEVPKFPYWGELDSVNFYGRENSRKLGSDMYGIWSAFTPVLVIGNAQAAKDFYKNQSSNTKDFSFLGWVFHATMGASLGLAHGTHWENMRHLFQRCFNGEFVKNQYETVTATIDEWISTNIESTVKDGEAVINLDESNLNALPMNILTRITYGMVPMEGRQMKKMAEFLKLHERLTRATNDPLTRIPGYKFLPTATNKLLKEFLNEWENFTYEIVADCKAEKPYTDNTILRCLIAEGLDQVLTKDELLQTIYELTLFNVDISHNALVCILAHVAGNSEVQAKLQEEINATHKGGGLSYTNINSMRYLDAVIKESARMNPSLTISFPEKISEPAYINGYYIPKNTQVCIDAHTLNFNPKYWEDPDTFNPERFLDSDNTPPPSTYHRFGIGARKCLGSKYADLALKYFVANIFGKFNVRIEARPGKTKQQGFVFFIPYVNTSSLVFSQRRNL